MDKPLGKGQRNEPVETLVICGVDGVPALLGTGVAVLVAGEDAAAVGSAVAALRSAGAEAAGWVGDPSDPAVYEMAAELFPGYEVGATPDVQPS